MDTDIKNDTDRVLYVPFGISLMQELPVEDIVRANYSADCTVNTLNTSDGSTSEDSEG